MRPLAKLVHDMSHDPEVEQKYRQDINAIAQRYDLSLFELQALTSGDLERIRKACGLQEGHLTNGTIRCHESGFLNQSA